MTAKVMNKSSSELIKSPSSVTATLLGVDNSCNSVLSLISSSVSFYILKVCTDRNQVKRIE